MTAPLVRIHPHSKPAPMLKDSRRTRPRQDWRALAIALIALGCSACATVKKASTDAQLVEAQQAFDEGSRLKEAGQYAEAVPLVERALELREAVLGSAHLEVASCLELLGVIHRRQGLYAPAEQFLQRTLAIREAALGKNHPKVATSLFNLANLQRNQGNYEQARQFYERALAIQEAALGKKHPDVAKSLNGLANLYGEQENDEQAEQLYGRALAIWEATLGRNHPLVAQTLSNLANLYLGQANYERARPLYERSLAIQEAALGREHPDIAIALNGLANLYEAQGQYARAEPLYERAIAILEATLGSGHPHVATALNNLADIYVAQGYAARAKPLYERTLAMREAALGKNHPELISSLNNLANLYARQGDYASARPLYERTLAITEAAFGKSHPDVALSLNNLANLHLSQGDSARAKSLYERALTIREASLGENHPLVATSVHNLANVYYAQGDFARAGPLYERALAIQETTLGDKHPEVARSLQLLARFHLDQRGLSKALPLFERAFTISEVHLRQEVYGYSDARLNSVLELLRAHEERIYALVRAYPDNARVRRLALATALLRKGRSIEEIAETSRIIYRSLGQADRDAFGRLRALRTQLAKLSLAESADHGQRVKELTEQADTLEADLARRSAPLRALFALPPPAELVEHVAAALPSDGALVEFVAYEDSPLVVRPGSPASQNPGELRYLALLLFSDGRTCAVDLGPAAAIDQAALRLHKALASTDVSYQSAARALHTRVFRPLTPLLGKAKRLFLSPDSQLALVPFDALHDGRRFLADGFDITYLTSGKDLLRRSEDISPARSVVVLADPDFESTPDTSVLLVKAAPGLVERSASLERFFSTLRSDGADHPWRPLPGTRQEAETIHRLLPHSQVLIGRAATKEALLKLTTPGVLHIATHGFFMGDDDPPAGTRTVGNIGAVAEAGPSHRPADPLLRSGLVLAGAHAPETESGAYRREDSLVTALELAGLDLWGTQLVVLSACDTGRGDVKLGQGVYGLRRSLVVAGAQTLVTSLWKVNDETTHQLMESYYRNLLAGQGRAEALRSAMRALRQKQLHPYFWAPFIAIGQDTPLQGLGPASESRSTP
jgi:CHAT domain-containing protein/Tfp pilus assembly protein PilF